MYHWAIKTHQKVVAATKVTSWYQKLRIVSVVSFDKKNVVLGGRNFVVEIDESLLIKVEHFKGKYLVRPQIWVFGLYERDTKRLLILVVPKGDAVILLNLIFNMLHFIQQYILIVGHSTFEYETWIKSTPFKLSIMIYILSIQTPVFILTVLSLIDAPGKL